MKASIHVQAWVLPLLAGLVCVTSARAQELHDPTRPPQVSAASVITTAAPARAARLEAVLFAADRAVAIIDGKLLHVGDWVGDARIAAISSDAVELTSGGRKLMLRLANPAMNVRRTAPSKDPQ